jgi:hypothetical protein
MGEEIPDTGIYHMRKGSSCLINSVTLNCYSIQFVNFSPLVLHIPFVCVYVFM